MARCARCSRGCDRGWATTSSPAATNVALALPEPVWIDIEAARAEIARAAQALERQDARAAWALAQVPLNIATRGLLPGVQAGVARAAPP